MHPRAVLLGSQLPLIPPRLCAVACVIRAGRVLLLRRGPGAPAPFRPGDWTLPGGGVEARDSSLPAAAARELREEVGLELVGGRVARVVDGLSAGPPFVTIVVVGTAEGEARNLEPEAHDELGWFGPGDLPERTRDRSLLLALLAEAQP
jgi:8-oxo-dGTP pyrophosphatase MutT (NUDIX family)